MDDLGPDHFTIFSMIDRSKQMRGDDYRQDYDNHKTWKIYITYRLLEILMALDIV